MLLERVVLAFRAALEVLPRTAKGFGVSILGAGRLQS